MAENATVHQMLIELRDHSLVTCDKATELICRAVNTETRRNAKFVRNLSRLSQADRDYAAAALLASAGLIDVQD